MDLGNTRRKKKETKEKERHIESKIPLKQKVETLNHNQTTVSFSAWIFKICHRAIFFFSNRLNSLIAACCPQIGLLIMQTLVIGTAVTITDQTIEVPNEGIFNPFFAFLVISN